MDYLTFQLCGGNLVLAGILLMRPFISFEVSSNWESTVSDQISQKIERQTIDCKTDTK